MMKYCLKKQMALVLSAVLLAISFVVPTAAESVELLGDGNFNGTAGERVPWQQVDNSAEKNAAFVYAEEAGRQFASGKAGSAVFKQVTLEANVSYTVSFEARFLGETVPDSFNSFYRAGFAANVSALSGGNFVGPNSTGNKYYSIYGSQLKKVKDGIIANVSAWGAHSFTFTPAADLTTYFVLGSYDSSCKATLEVDNAFICKTEDIKTVKVEATGDNTAAASSALGLPGTVLTATAAGTNQFLGWYKNGTLVSTSAVYTLETVLEEDSTFLAKFSGNIIKNGGFEALAAGDLNTRYDAGGTLQNFAWGRVATSVTCGTVVANGEDAHAGSNYLSFHPTADANQFIRTVGTVVPVEQNKQYRLTFWAKSLSAENETNISAAILTTNATNIDGKIDGKPLVKILKENTDWQEYTLIFNSSSYTQVVVAFGGNTTNGAANYAIDDVTLCEVVELITKVNTTGAAGKVVGGTVSGDGTYNSGDEVTLTATPKAGFTFTGWSDGEANAVRTVSAANATYTANFANAGKNLIANGNLESNDFTVADVFEKVGAKALLERVDSPTGTGYALKATANKDIGLAVNGVQVQAGHSYVFRCKFYLATQASHAGANNLERIGYWKDGFSNFNKANFPFGKNAYAILMNGEGAAVGEWKEFSVMLTPEQDATIAVGIGTVDASCNIDWYIDDIALYDLTACGVVATGVDSSTGKLNEAGFSAAIRAASNTDGNIQKNGLRVYNAVEKDLLGDVVEYGTIVVRKGYLQKANNSGWKGTNLAGQTFAEPTVEMYGIGGIGFGVAYRKAGTTTATGSSAVKPILWRDDLNGVAMYTAFATGIAEAYYGDAYLYRSYAVLSNGAVVYGRTVEVSVFDVANAISNAETAPEVDTAAFNAFVNENTGTAYEKWCADNAKETGKLYNK